MAERSNASPISFKIYSAWVAERSNALDCKSSALAATQVRILPHALCTVNEIGTRGSKEKVIIGIKKIVC